MLKTIFRITLLLVSLLRISTASAQSYPFMNPELPMEQRVDDLISRLTLEEKVRQMMHTTPAIERLGIPRYNWWNECLHGVGRSGDKVTVFPQAIAMAATFDAEALERMGEITSDEARAIYNESVRKGNPGEQYKGLTFWTPNINIFRDPRWGRGQETYGEDPYLTAKMGAAIVHGLQGKNPNYLKTSACAKHYAVHSGPEKGRHEFNSVVSSYDLWDTYLPAFQELVVDANVSSVMCAYNRYDGQACCANDLLLTRILREYWQFNGYVTSDCGAVHDFYRHHRTHADAAASAADAVVHGTDLECGNEYGQLIEAVKQGLVSERQLNVSLRRLFTIRFRLGMFDPVDKVPYSKIPYSILEHSTHQEHALKMARQSMVLLKNSGNTLPLSKKLKKVAVIGPNADKGEVQLGNYNGFPSKIVTVREGIQAKLGKGAQIIYDEAVDYTKPLGTKANLKAIAAKAKQADVIIFVGGISPRLEGEEGDAGQDRLEGFEGGDRTDIRLPAIQTELLKELKATGKPVVLVCMSGSAIGLPWEAEHLDGILQAWYGGQSAGTAVADILFGDYNPSGRLPVTFYKGNEDLPNFHDYSMADRTYRYFKGQPLYPFGYGLSYTTFEYSKVNAPQQAITGNTITVTATVRNAGTRAGDEVVQLYLVHPSTQGTRPLRALQGFQRVSLQAGESKEVRFTLSPRNLALVDNAGNLAQTAGPVEIYIGGGQPDATTAKATVNITGERFEVL